MALPIFKEQWTNPPSSAGQTTIQTTAAIVVALATVFAVVFQSKDSPKFAGALVILCLLVLALTFARRALSFFQIRRTRAVRNKAAQAQHSELLRFARRLAQFNNSGDPTNIRNIILTSSNHNPEKCAELCPPDFMRELYPFFLQQFEARPPENESQFLLATQELYGLVASYNNHYVLEPFRRMRQARWLTNATTTPSLVADSVPWIESLPEMYRANAERQVEDFRERWAGFLDDMKQWLESVNDSFGANLPVWFERPHKL